MPPQGLLVIAAAVPASWQVRFVDENIAEVTAEDFRWAEAIFVSGMHIQRRQIEDICRRAHAYGRTTVLGGSSVSAAPERYPDFDYLHVGEIGDATDELFARLARDPSRPRTSGRAHHARAARTDAIFRCRPTSSPISSAIFSAASSSRAAVPINASSATYRSSTDATRGSRARSRSLPNSTSSWPAAATARFISSTIISSPTAVRCASCCPISWHGRSATAIRSISPARPRSTSPSGRTCSR